MLVFASGRWSELVHLTRGHACITSFSVVSDSNPFRQSPSLHRSPLKPLPHTHSLTPKGLPIRVDARDRPNGRQPDDPSVPRRDAVDIWCSRDYTGLDGGTAGPFQANHVADLQQLEQRIYSP
jgi:hypothetical protein